MLPLGTLCLPREWGGLVVESAKFTGLGRMAGHEKMKRFQYAVVLILMLGVMSACQKPKREAGARMDHATPVSAKEVYPPVIGDWIPKLVLEKSGRWGI